MQVREAQPITPHFKYSMWDMQPRPAKDMNWEGWQIVANLMEEIIRSHTYMDKNEELCRDWVPSGYLHIHITRTKWCEYREDYIDLGTSLLVKDNEPQTILKNVQEWCEENDSYLCSLVSHSCVGPRWTAQNGDTIEEVIAYIKSWQ